MLPDEIPFDSSGMPLPKMGLLILGSLVYISTEESGRLEAVGYDEIDGFRITGNHRTIMENSTQMWPIDID